MSNLGNKQIMARNIQKYLDVNGITRYEFCEALGFKYSTVGEWLGAKKYPRIDKIEKMADYFKIDKAHLIEDVRDIFVDVTGIPVLGSVAAGAPIDMNDSIIGQTFIDSSMAERGSYFALRIKGDSMSPRICDGDIVIVRQQEDVESGEIAIVAVDADTATCKRVKKYHDGIELISNNVAYDPMFFSSADEGRVRILGKVVEFRGMIE